MGDKLTETLYKGGCQCREAPLDAELDQVTTCNCSRCQALGPILAFASRAKFALHLVTENLREYRFTKRETAQLFYKTGGIQSYSFGKLPDGIEVAAIN